MKERILEINQPRVGDLIRNLRLEIGLTQEKFAALLGVTWLTVNRWENGRTQPLPLAIKQIEKIMYRTSDAGKALLPKHLPNI